MYHGLYLDDDFEKLTYLAEIMKNTSELDLFSDPRLALKALERNDYDFMIIDIHMPIMNGLEFIKVVKSSQISQCDNLFILSTAQDNETKVKGLSLGVKDYLSFEMCKEEILLRIKNQLDSCDYLRTSYKHLSLDKDRSAITNGELEVILTPTEYRIVTHMFRMRGAEEDIDKLIQSVWNGTVVSKQTFNTHLSNLNRKIEMLSIDFSRIGKNGLCVNC